MKVAVYMKVAGIAETLINQITAIFKIVHEKIVLYTFAYIYIYMYVYLALNVFYLSSRGR